MAPDTPDAGQVLGFQAGGRRFALPADQVREVARMPRLTNVPHAPASLLGIGNIRGEATAIVSAARLMELAEDRPRQLIVLAGEHPTALAIDRIEGVIAKDADHALAPFADLIAAAFPERAATGGSAGSAQSSVAAATEARTALLAFAIGDQSFALPLESIEGVLQLPGEVARIPHADAATLGSFVWRDQPVPLFSLAALLDLPDAPGKAARVVVVRIGSQRAGLRVDRIEALLRAPASRIDPVPLALQRGQTEAVIQAIHRPADGGRLVSILGTGQLFREELTGMLEAAPAAARAEAEAQAVSEPLLVFESAGQRFAIPLHAVRQVVRRPARLSPLPNAPAFVVGVTGHRGEALVVVDLGLHLGGEPTTGGKARLLVLPVAGAEAGLIVERVTGIARMPVQAIAPAPLGTTETAPFVQVVSLDDGETATLVLASDELLGRIEADLIAGIARGSAAAS